MVDRCIEGTVEKIISGGDGLVRQNGAVFFVPGVLSGEKIRFDVVERKKNWARARLTDILEASSDRREPFCPLFGRCGGCSWQHMDYTAQLEAKKCFIKETLVRQGGLIDEAIPDFLLIPSRPESYRSRIRPLILPDGTAAFRQASSDRPLRISRCPVAVPGVNRFLEQPSEGLSAGGEPIVFGDENDFWVEGLDREARADVGGKSFCFPPGVFFQSNLTPLPELISFALDGPHGRLAEDDGADADSPSEEPPSTVALDLYGGVGLFGAFLADRFRTVIGVDRDAAAESAWRHHVGSRGDFYAVSLESWTASKGRPVPDFIVVDPPRTGLSPSVRRVLTELRAPEISYVSCDPVTQARDLKDLIAAGYVLSEFALVDLYPQTPHVETVARLRYGGNTRF